MLEYKHLNYFPLLNDYLKGRERKMDGGVKKYAEVSIWDADEASG
jgi:hypothetical protein